MKLSEIKHLCQINGIKPSKSKGQNFLIDDSVLQKIVQAANLKKNDKVLEIGPGFGVLTEQLVENCQRVLTVELDKSLAFFLRKRFRGQPNLAILEQDILKVKNSDLADKLDAKEYKLVANLPYNITKPLIRKFLTYDPKPREIVVLVQKEVAQKIVAKPGKMSILAISVQFYGQPEIIDYVGKRSFYPEPQVDSAILKITIFGGTNPHLEKLFSGSELNNFQENKFWQVVKIGFSSPRKQLHNNLAAGLQISSLQAKKILVQAGLNEAVRAQDLALANWLDIYQQVGLL